MAPHLASMCSKMASSSHTKGVTDLQQNHPRTKMPRTIIPAIPLPYVQKRRKNQAERIQVLKKVETAAAVATEASLPETQEDLSQSNTLTKTLVDGENHQVVSNLNKPVTSHPSEIRFECAYQDMICKETIKPVSNKSPVEIEETTYSERDEVKAETINLMKNYPKQESKGRTGNLSKGPSVVIDSNQECMFSLASHKVALDKDSTNLSPMNEKICQPMRLSSQQTFGSNNVNYNGSVVIASHLNSTGSSPAPLQAVVQAAPVYGYGKPPPGYHSQVPSSNQHMPAVYSMQPPPPPVHYLPSDEFLNGLFTNEFSRKQIILSGLTDRFSPSAAPSEAHHPHNSTTLNSFHGSHTSTQDNDSGAPFFKQNSTNIFRNGGNEQVEDLRSTCSKSSANRSLEQFSLPLLLRNQATQIDMFGGLPEYLITQFADPVFADCTLELRYSDDRDTPICIPGHSLIFARSITLKEMILTARRESEGMTSRTLLIETHDRFLCTNGFYMAIHRLYGSSLLDLGPIIPMCPASQQNVPFTVTTTDRFNLALGYAAAGHLLKLDGVVSRGCEIAGLALNWETLEKGLDFALDGGLEDQWTIQGWDYRSAFATYGPGVNMIILKAMELICHNFPVSFELDTSVGEAKFAPRLPTISYKRQSSLSSRLSQIRFGDYATEDPQHLSDCQTPCVILSRVLLNLPWNLLQFLFESSHLTSTIGNLAARHRVLSDIVQEREKRRLDIVNCLKLNSEDLEFSREWEAVGWEESVKDLCQGDRWPRLTRTRANLNILKP